MRVNVYLRQYVTNKKEKRYYLVVRQAGLRDQNVQLGCISRKEAERRRVLTHTEILNGVYHRPSQVRIFFSEFCHKFIEEFAKGFKAKKTVSLYEHSIKPALKAFQGLQLDQIRSEDVERLLARLPVSNRTKNITLSTLRMIFEKAVDWGYLPTSQVHKIKRFKEEKGGSRALVPQELGKLLDVANPWQASLIKVMVYTGLRSGELSQLKFEDIDWENKSLRVVSNQERKTKNRKSRTVPMSPDLANELKFLEENLPNVYFQSSQDVPPYYPRTTAQKNFVFCRTDGSPIRCFRKSLENAFKKAGLRGVSPHSLRKTFCSLLARQKVHPKVAQQLLGHSDIRLTMDIYTEIADDQLQEAVCSLPSIRDLQKEKFRVIVGDR